MTKSHQIPLQTMLCEDNNIQRLHALAILLIVGGIVTTIVGAIQIPQTPNGGAPFIGDAATYNEALQKEQLRSTGFRVIVIGLSVFGSGFIIVVFRVLFYREELTDPLPLQQSIALNLPLPPQQSQRRVRIVPEAIVIREEPQEQPQQEPVTAPAPAPATAPATVPAPLQQKVHWETYQLRPMAAGPHITIIPRSGPRRSDTTTPV